jgi:hypothetical protein
MIFFALVMAMFVGILIGTLGPRVLAFVDRLGAGVLDAHERQQVYRMGYDEGQEDAARALVRQPPSPERIPEGGGSLKGAGCPPKSAPLGDVVFRNVRR